MIYLICPTRALFLTGGHSNQDHRCTQKPTYTPIFTHNIRSSLLRTRKSIYLPSTMYQVYINSGKRGERQEIYDTWYNLAWLAMVSGETLSLQLKSKNFVQNCSRTRSTHTHSTEPWKWKKKEGERTCLPASLKKRTTEHKNWHLVLCFLQSAER